MVRSLLASLPNAISSRRGGFRRIAGIDPGRSPHDHGIFTANPEDDLELVMGMMTTHRVRHLPVIEDEQLVGIVSIGDIVKAHHGRLCMENEYLKHYIQS